MGSCLFDFGVVLDYVSTSAGVIQVFGPKLCARPRFPEKSQTDNSAYLRGALSLVGFIAVCDFIHVSHEIIAQIYKHFKKKKRHTDGQEAHKKLFIITDY